VPVISRRDELPDRVDGVLEALRSLRGCPMSDQFTMSDSHLTMHGNGGLNWAEFQPILNGNSRNEAAP
jgi:hypothetical protein